MNTNTAAVDLLALWAETVAEAPAREAAFAAARDAEDAKFEAARRAAVRRDARMARLTAIGR